MSEPLLFQQELSLYAPYTAKFLPCFRNTDEIVHTGRQALVISNVCFSKELCTIARPVLWVW